MIRLNCPNCGRRGTIPESKVRTRLHCPKCEAVFHVRPDGTAVPGEPPVGKAARGDPYQRLSDLPADDAEPRGALELMELMPLPFLAGLVVFLLVILVWGLRALRAG